MSGLDLVVGPAVIRDTIERAALAVPGVLRVGRSGGQIRAWLVGPAIVTRLDGVVATVRIAIVARPGGSLRAVAAQVHAAVCAALEGQLGLAVGAVEVTIDGVGA
jgi:uncharacterized alkaline shock family protein YloU